MALQELFEEDLKIYASNRFVAFLDEETLARFLDAAESMVNGPTTEELAEAPLLNDWMPVWR